MDETGICGRNNEIKEIQNYIQTKLVTKTSGVLYLTGPPGTGKTMSVGYILDNLIDKQLPKLTINCLKIQSSKTVLTKLCNFVGLDKFTNCNEVEMIARLAKKFSGRTSGSHLIVLDEMDKIPKSKNIDLIKTIFSWPYLSSSKLILIGIANITNLTVRYQAMSHILGTDYSSVTRIVFRPYTSKDIKAIMQWYLDNDENFEDAFVDPKALDMIAARSARDNGDIRGALNALKSSIDDSIKIRCANPRISQFPTPPSTPPPSPYREKTNIASVANSIKKRQRNTHYADDKFPFPHQVILTCILKLCAKSRAHMVDTLSLKTLVVAALTHYGLPSHNDDYRAMLDNLELQGFIAIKKGRPRERIILKASSQELIRLIQRHDMVMDLLNAIA